MDQDHNECNFGCVDGEDLLTLIEAEVLERVDDVVIRSSYRDAQQCSDSPESRFWLANSLYTPTSNLYTGARMGGLSFRAAADCLNRRD